MSNTVNSALARTDWKLLARQRFRIVRLLSESHTDRKLSDDLLGLLVWLDAIQDAAEAEGYPVVFLAEG